MRILAARAVALLVLFCLPFVLLAVASGRREGALYLMFPVILALPVVLGALIVFAPLESYLDGRGLGRLKNAAVPLAGGVLVVVVLAVVAWIATTSGNPHVRQRALDGFARYPVRQVLYVAAGAVPGAVAAALWRLTDWAVTLVGLRGRP